MNTKQIIYAVLVLQILDVITTIIGLSKGATEVNRFVATIIIGYGFIGLIVLKIIAFCAVVFFLYEFSKYSTPKTINYFGLFITTILLIVVFSNLTSLHEAGVI